MGCPISDTLNGGEAMENKIKRIRKESNLTQIELAERSGVSLPTIRRAEAGNNVSVPVLLKLSKTLNAPIDYLIGGGSGATDDQTSG